MQRKSVVVRDRRPKTVSGEGPLVSRSVTGVRLVRCVNPHGDLQPFLTDLYSFRAFLYETVYIPET